MRQIRLTPLVLAALALACPAQTPPRAPEPSPRDDRRPEQALTVDAFGRPVQLGGSWQYTDERRVDFDLDTTKARDRRVREHELKLEARVRLGDQTDAFAQIVGLHESRRTQGTAGQRVTRSLERGQLWLEHRRIGNTPWSFQIGRLALLDRRAWWWDEDLDAVRLRYDEGPVRLDTGLAREVARKSSAEQGIAPAAQGVIRMFGQATWRWAPQHALDAFWLVQTDRTSQATPGTAFPDEAGTDASDLRGRWVGLRATGEWRMAEAARLGYWADTSWLSGQERLTAFEEEADGRLLAGATVSQRVRGGAFDVGITSSWTVPMRPSLTLGYARGSVGFRQTGLQENKSRFAGVKRWQRYGELVQPELANLSVATLGVGVRVLRNSSVELVAHRLRQARAADQIPGARLSAQPLGTNRALGTEVNLLLAVRDSKRLEFTLKASRFKPGAAFAPDRRQPARAIEFGVTYNF